MIIMSDIYIGGGAGEVVAVVVLGQTYIEVKSMNIMSDITKNLREIKAV